MQSRLSITSLINHAFVAESKSHYHTQGHLGSPMLSPGSFVVLHFTFSGGWSYYTYDT